MLPQQAKRGFPAKACAYIRIVVEAESKRQALSVCL